MLKISDVESSTALDGLFTDGNVAGGISPTRLVAAWFNAIQTELVNVVESSGMELDPDDSTQVLQALTKMFLSRSNPFADIAADGTEAIAQALANLRLGGAALMAAATAVVSSTAGQLAIPALISGREENLIIQWGVVDAPRQATTNVTLPFTYDNECLFTLAVKGSAISLTGEYGVGCSPVNNSTIAVSNSNGGTGSTQGIRYLTIGY